MNRCYVDLKWKGFSVNVTLIEQWLKTNAGPNYVSSNAGSSLKLYFTQEPSKQDSDAIKLYWKNLTDQSDEAKTYKSRDQLKSEADAYKAELETIKDGMIAKTWNTLKGPERKLLLGKTVERQEFVDAGLLE